MKSLFCLLVSSFLTVPAFATIPSSSINQATLYIHGIYTTSDPTCRSDLIATVPLKKDAVAFNLAAAPNLGKGLAADPIKCVIFVMKSQATVAWNAGSYTSTTNGNSDNVCNAGGSTSFALCPSSMSTFWPDAIKEQASAVGLTRTDTCTGSTTDTIPLYLSSYARCSGDTSVDPASCNSGYAVNMPPTAEDALAGIKISTPNGNTGIMAFNVDVSRVVGNNGGGACGSPNPPTFSFVDSQ